MERSKEVLGEYLALIDKGRREPPNSEAPWKHIEAWKRSTMKHPTVQRMMNTSEKVSGMMNTIAFESVKGFQDKFGPAYDAANAADAPKAPEKQQPGRVIEKQNPAGPGLQGPGI